MAASGKLVQRLHQVGGQLDHLIELAADHDLQALAAPGVSRWSVGRQLEHLMLSDRTILDRFDGLIDGSEESVDGGLTMVGRIVLTSGYIPRGAGKSPRAVEPAGRDAADVEAALRRVRQRLDELAEHLAPLEQAGWRFRHPYFGALDVGGWMRFMDVHHRHHLKIVRDIRKAASSG